MNSYRLTEYPLSTDRSRNSVTQEKENHKIESDAHKIEVEGIQRSGPKFYFGGQLPKIT
jgi:hypothetical protein